MVIFNVWVSGLVSLIRYFNFRMDLGNFLYVCNKIIIVNNVGYLRMLNFICKFFGMIDVFYMNSCFLWYCVK